MAQPIEETASYFSSGSDVEDRDEEILSRLGKKPVLKRTFGFATILGFTSTITVLWESTLLLMGQSLHNGGPQSFIYGFVVVWMGSLAVFACLSELASMAPTAGGQFHWVAMLSPRSCQRYTSYIEGWLSVIGWLGSSVTAAVLSSKVLFGLVKLCHPDFVFVDWHTVVLSIGFVLFSMLINVTGGVMLPRFEGMVLVLHLVGFFAVLVPILTLGQRQDSTAVFDVFRSEGNLPDKGVTFWVGLAGIMYAFRGGDGAIYMSEEIPNAPVVVPRGIMFSYLVNGALAFGIAIAVLFAQVSPDLVLKPPSGFAIIEIISESVDSLPGAAIMVSVIVVLQISAGVSNFASASRILWSFARDHGVPGWKRIQRVDERTTVPLYACLITAVFSAGMSCLVLGTSTYFRDIEATAVGGLYCSYLVACLMLLYRRCSGVIVRYDPKEKDPVNRMGVRLMWGPFHLPGLIGIAVNVLAVAFLACSIVFVFWPIGLPVVADEMNYGSAIVGGVVLLASLYYVFWGRRDYYGPVVETSAGLSRHDRHPSLRRSMQHPSLRSQRSRATAAGGASFVTNRTVSRPPTVRTISRPPTALEKLDRPFTILDPLDTPPSEKAALASLPEASPPSDFSRAPTATEGFADHVESLLQLSSTEQPGRLSPHALPIRRPSPALFPGPRLSSETSTDHPSIVSSQAGPSSMDEPRLLAERLARIQQRQPPPSSSDGASLRPTRSFEPVSPATLLQPAALSAPLNRGVGRSRDSDRISDDVGSLQPSEMSPVSPVSDDHGIDAALREGPLGLLAKGI